MSFSLVVVALCVALVAAQTRVELEQGPLRGFVKTTAMGDVAEFLGIPYAMPPVGALRFKGPAWHEGWGSAERDATRYGASCMQKPEQLRNHWGLDQATLGGMTFDEDCLFVNVHVPGNRVDPSANLPVMVWVHGGELEYGSSQLVGTTTVDTVEGLVINGDVIVVTLNYRLNVFGFLNFPNDGYKEDGDKEGDTKEFVGGNWGNMGVWDVHVALNWVKVNIAKFGGNPSKVTLFGDEEGSTLTSLLILHPGSAGLFQQVALQSAAPAGYKLPERFDQSMLDQLGYYVKDMACQADNYTAVFLCLQQASAQALLDAFGAGSEKLIVDGHLLKAQFDELWYKGDFNAVDVIIGYNSGDGDWLLRDPARREVMLRQGMDKTTVEQTIDAFVLPMLGYPPSSTQMGRDLAMMAKANYFSSQDPQDALRAAMDLMRDAFLSGPNYKVAYFMSQAGSNVYMYQFSHSSPPNTRRYANASFAVGAGVGTEVWYVLGDTTMTTNGQTQPEDSNLAFSMMNAWSSFAATGEPKFLDADGAEVSWPRFDKHGMAYVDFKPPMGANSIQRSLNLKAAVLWNMLLPAMHKVLKLEATMGAGDVEEDDEPMPDGGGEVSRTTPPSATTHKAYPEGPEPEAEAAGQMMETSFYVMLALVCLLVILMVAVFGMMCIVCSATRKHGSGKHP